MEDSKSLVRLESDQIFGVGLGVVVRDIDTRVIHVVHSAVVQCTRSAVSDFRSDGIHLSYAVLSHSNTACHDILKAIAIWNGIRCGRRIAAFFRKVDPLPPHGGILSTKRSIEPLLKNLVHDLEVRTMKKPHAFEPIQLLLLFCLISSGVFLFIFTMADGLPLDHITLPHGQILDALHLDNLSTGYILCLEKGILNTSSFWSHRKRVLFGYRWIRDICPSVRRG
mmetsp:Transcript_14856/g.19437  ORF Transcript_14856/g.19437 Transcript_14856/m.19437 type:complete len:224 (+) Transcript_14856:203-874(+)